MCNARLSFTRSSLGCPSSSTRQQPISLVSVRSFFGIEQKGELAGLDHYDFGIAGFNADEVIDKLKARNLKPEPGGNKESFKFHDPDGFLVQVNGPAYEGHVGS